MREKKRGGFKTPAPFIKRKRGPAHMLWLSQKKASARREFLRPPPLFPKGEKLPL